MNVALVMKYVVNYCQEEQWCLQLYITNKMSTSVLKVGMPSGSVTVIILVLQFKSGSVTV